MKIDISKFKKGFELLNEVKAGIEIKSIKQAWFFYYSIKYLENHQDALRNTGFDPEFVCTDVLNHLLGMARGDLVLDKVVWK